MKFQNKKLRNELKILRKSKNELLYKMVQVGYMKKNELSKALEEERLRREQLGNLASSAVTEEERERYHNEIVDCESVIQSLEEDLKMYDECLFTYISVLFVAVEVFPKENSLTPQQLLNKPKYRS